MSSDKILWSHPSGIERTKQLAEEKGIEVISDLDIAWKRKPVFGYRLDKKEYVQDRCSYFDAKRANSSKLSLNALSRKGIMMGLLL